jgi:thioredoxin-like negative regulator of GroEL
MYRRSFLTIVMVILFMGIVATGSRWVSALSSDQLPSSYDPGISVMQAAETSKKPLLIEFYTDTCRTCRIVTPWVATLGQGKYKNDLTFVMVDMNDASQSQIAGIFGVRFVPVMFVFDFAHMTKVQVDEYSYASKEKLDHAIGQALKQARQQASAKSKGA